MALLTCPECGKEYSSFAPACPQCGFPTSMLPSPNSSTVSNIEPSPAHNPIEDVNTDDNSMQNQQTIALKDEVTSQTHTDKIGPDSDVLPPVPEEKVDAKKTEQATPLSDYDMVKASMHWLPRWLLVFSLIAYLVSIINSFADNSIAAALYDLAYYLIAAVFVIGLLQQKKWGLIGYFVCRAFAFITFIILGEAGGESIIQEIFKLCCVVIAFSWREDGYSLFYLAWKNGDVFVKKAKPKKIVIDDNGFSIGQSVITSEVIDRDGIQLPKGYKLIIKERRYGRYLCKDDSGDVGVFRASEISKV